MLLDSKSPSRDDHTGILQHFSFSLALRSENMGLLSDVLWIASVSLSVYDNKQWESDDAVPRPGIRGIA